MGTSILSSVSWPSIRAVQLRAMRLNINLLDILSTPRATTRVRRYASSEVAKQCHPERSEGSGSTGKEMLRGVYPECNEWAQHDKAVLNIHRGEGGGGG